MTATAPISSHVRTRSTARDAILAARRAGKPGFLLGDLTGLGKTLSAWLAISAMPEQRRADRSARRAPSRNGGAPSPARPTPANRVTLMNFERTKSLMAPPAVSTRRSTRAKNNELAKHGAPKRIWPLVVIDEAHRIRNPNSQQGMVCRQVAAAADFTIYMSATAGQAPHELSYLAQPAGACDRRSGRRPRRLPRADEAAEDRPRQGALEELVLGAQRGRPQDDVRPALQGHERHRPAPPARGHRRLAGGAARAGADRARCAAAPALRRDLARVPARARAWPAARPASPPAGPPICAFARRPACCAPPAPPISPTICCGNGQQVALSVAFLETSTMLIEKLRGARLARRRDQRHAVRRAQRGGPPRLPDRRARRRHLHRHRIDLAASGRDSPAASASARWSSTTCATAPSSCSRSRAAATATASAR